MYFPAPAASILFLSIFGHKIGVLKSPALFQGKEFQVTRFKLCSSVKTKNVSQRWFGNLLALFIKVLYGK